ncbi:MAG: hypothetical protein HC915_15010 [Anaerolineae bacterium]|nr:hypothetical protein [Anaerolineae bacterium]
MDSVGDLDYPGRLPDLIKMHAPVPHPVLEEGLPPLLEILGDMDGNSEAWQRAMAILSLPLLAGWPTSQAQRWFVPQ